MNVAFDHAGNLWVADLWNSRLLDFVPPFHSGMNASVVIGQTNFSTAFFNTTRNGFSGPEQVAFDSSGNLWVADGGNGRVLEFQPPFSTGMNASLVLGEPDFTHRYCQPSTLGSHASCSNHSLLTGPGGIAFDPQGDLWITESYAINGRLVEFKPPFKSGMQTSLEIEPVFASAITFDSTGNLWLGCWSCGRAVEYRAPLSENSIVWENGVPLNSTISLGYTPSGNYSFNNVIRPVGLALDSAGNLWVVDSRSSWLMADLIGRVVGYDAQVHSLDTREGRVYFENQGGLLAPLSAIPFAQMDSIQFPEGLFNFTIQGLPAGGSVTVTISFPHALPLGIEWWSRQGDQWNRLPATQVHLEGNNMTLIFTHASPDGVISEVGGPAEAPANVTAYTETSSVNTFSPQNELVTTPTPPAITLASVAGAIAAVSLVVFYWKHKRKQTSPRSVR